MSSKPTVEFHPSPSSKDETPAKTDPFGEANAMTFNSKIKLSQGTFTNEESKQESIFTGIIS